MSKKGPFDVIVITSPDDKTAVAVRELIVSSCGQFPPGSLENDESTVMESRDGTLFISTCDPYGARMGSGGGTIAALAEADSEFMTRNQRLPTILICHAGGESSRCPTQISLGKAWTSLPIVYGHEPDVLTGASLSTKVSNPTSLLIDSLNTLFEDVPEGSVVIAATDVLLSFDDPSRHPTDASKRKKINFNNLAKDDNSNRRVFGLAVPAPLEIAKNHGVFVLESNSSTSDSQDDDWGLQPTFRVLQKPSVQEMMDISNPPCAFHLGDESIVNLTSRDDELAAWIDTGVITFLPGASAVLRDVTKSVWTSYTKQGLKQTYDRLFCSELTYARGTEDAKRDGVPSLQEFAKGRAANICLYSDILRSLKTVGLDTSSLENDFMSSISSSFSKLELFTCTILSGTFVHLGTTGELLDFLTLGTSARDDGKYATDSFKQWSQTFGKSIGLTKRAQACVNCYDRDNIQPSVILNSYINNSNGKDALIIGKGSIIEHCRVHIDGTALLRVQIGDRCLISGLRLTLQGPSLRIPSGICLQILPFSSKGLQEQAIFVCLCFGVDDDIKAIPPKTLFGLELQYVLTASGLDESDLWDDSIPSNKRMLWNARILPMIYQDTKLSFLEWIHSLVDNFQNATITKSPPLSRSALDGFRQWKESDRLSVSELRQHISPQCDVTHRKDLISHQRQNILLTTSKILSERRHEPCQLEYVLDFVSNSRQADISCLCQFSEVRAALHNLEAVILCSVAKGCFDIVGRTFMTMAFLLSDIGDSLGALTPFECDDSYSHDEHDALMLLKGPFWSSSDLFSRILNIKDGLMGPHKISSDTRDLFFCVRFLERASAVMIERCVRRLSPSLIPSTTSIPPGITVVASAPARVDINGGWSDTPPISFEHGGAVACLAVTVDEQRPLQARCRMVKGLKGIILRAESRSLKDGALLSSAEVSIQCLGDMADFRDPLSKCSLLKCALVLLQLVTVDEIITYPSNCISPYFVRFCKRLESNDDVGLEVVSVSTLPTGSGMGGSSILGGCILAAIGRCVGVIFDDMSLINAVLILEQMLTTGGGWQDQIGGLIGGLKLGTSDAGAVLETKVQQLLLPHTVAEELSQRLVLVYTGQPRLAKNILQTVIRRWSFRSDEIVSTVQQLVLGASQAVEAIMSGDFDELGACMSSYWDLKKRMAGSQSGVEPWFVKNLTDLLFSKGDIIGATLCGAGGGGFLVMLLSRGKALYDVRQTVEDSVIEGFENISWHSCAVDEKGINVELVQEGE